MVYLEDESRREEKARPSFCAMNATLGYSLQGSLSCYLLSENLTLHTRGGHIQESAACGGGSKRLCEVHLSKENKTKNYENHLLFAYLLFTSLPSRTHSDRRRLRELKMLSILAINARSHVASIQSISRRATSESEWPGH